MIIIGQITDLHGRMNLPGSSISIKRRSRDMGFLFEKALQRFQSESVDVIVVTGDLIDIPWPLLEPNDYYDFNLDLIKAQAKKDYLVMKNLLDQTQMPYMVLPGNYDLPAIFWKVFDRGKNEITIKDYRVIRFCDHEVNKQAHRFDYERKQMLSVLADDNQLPQIHLQHYVIHPELNKGYPHTYFDATDIKTKLIESKKVKLSISGHYHPGTELLSVGGTTFVTGPSFSESPYPIRIYSVSENNIELKTINMVETPIYAGKPIAFLDRDGVINTLPAYHTGPDLLVLTENAGKAIANLHEAGYVVVVITSQSCVGNGFVHEKIIHANHDHLCYL